MAEDKTGALLGAACQLGVIAGDAGSGQSLHYRELGRHLGIAFQLADDLLGIRGDAQIAGKSAGADLTARKKPPPVVAAMASGTDAGLRLAALYRRTEPTDGQWITETAELVELAGSRARAQQEADLRRTSALAPPSGTT